MLEAGGGYLGSTLGAFAYDLLGFQWATVVESGVGLFLNTSTNIRIMMCSVIIVINDIKIILIVKVMAVTVLVLVIYMLARRR